MQQLKSVLLEHAITLFNNTAIPLEKTHSDSAMISAVDLLYSDKE
jgi:hypothetical protein